MTIPIHLTEISTFEWSENENPPFLVASSRHVAILIIGIEAMSINYLAGQIIQENTIKNKNILVLILELQYLHQGVGVYKLS